jgi:hypothetical protein
MRGRATSESPVRRLPPRPSIGKTATRSGDMSSQAVPIESTASGCCSSRQSESAARRRSAVAGSAESTCAARRSSCQSAMRRMSGVASTRAKVTSQASGSIERSTVCREPRRQSVRQ